MPRVKIESLQEGMVVAGDVKNIDGMLLIPAGSTLGTRQINILQAWGVAEIEVRENDQTAALADDPLTALSPETLSELKTQLLETFWQTDEASPVFKEMFQLILQRRAARLRA